MNRVQKITLTAGFALAMVLTVGCGGNKPATVSDIRGEEEVTSYRNELQKLCNKDFIEKNFCGIGQGTSESESMAAQIASTNAKAELAASVQTSIESRAKTFGMNDPDGNAMEGAAMRAIANVAGDISDIRTQESKMTHNKDGKLTVYVLLTTSRDAALELAKQKLRASQELQQIQRTLNLDANVDRILDQEPTQVK